MAERFHIVITDLLDDDLAPEREVLQGLADVEALTVLSEAELAAKRPDYFQAGTLVVWDVDPVARTVAVYRADQPTRPMVYKQGQVADAEPAVPEWRLAVDDVFP